MRTLFTEGEDQAAELPTWSSDVKVAVFEQITPWPNSVDESAVTSPFVRALEHEGPTSIYDRSPERANSEELDDSYEAALKKFV